MIALPPPIFRGAPTASKEASPERPTTRPTASKTSVVVLPPPELIACPFISLPSCDQELDAY